VENECRVSDVTEPAVENECRVSDVIANPAFNDSQTFPKKLVL